MTKLSPQAQAVLDADASGLAYNRRIAIAAALRAAVDQEVPEIGYEADWHEPVEQELQHARNRLLAIADELKNHQ